MNTTFYGVLGVGPDADDDAIRAAYRERVKDHHPDVSTASDAAERFKRLTAAKEALLDPEERRRYDRLGHASYVDARGDPSLWEIDRSSSEAAEPSSGTDGSPETDRASSRADSANRTASSTRQTTAGPRSASTGSGPASGKSQSASARSRAASTGGSDSADTSRDSRTRTGTRSRRAGSATSTSDAWWAERGTSESAAASGESASAGSTSTAAAGSHTRSSFWDAADADASNGGRPDPLLWRAVGLLRALGGWVLVHLLFLALAVGTGWYVYAVVAPPAHRSLPLLFVVLGEVALALFLSSMHVLSRVYR